MESPTKKGTIILTSLFPEEQNWLEIASSNTPFTAAHKAITEESCFVITSKNSPFNKTNISYNYITLPNQTSINLSQEAKKTIGLKLDFLWKKGTDQKVQLPPVFCKIIKKMPQFLKQEVQKNKVDQDYILKLMTNLPPLIKKYIENSFVGQVYDFSVSTPTLSSGPLIRCNECAACTQQTTWFALNIYPYSRFGWNSVFFVYKDYLFNQQLGKVDKELENTLQNQLMHKAKTLNLEESVLSTIRILPLKNGSFVFFEITWAEEESLSNETDNTNAETITYYHLGETFQNVLNGYIQNLK